jgi:hypothetical protein
MATEEEWLVERKKWVNEYAKIAAVMQDMMKEFVSDKEIFLELYKQLISLYMKPSTATTPESQKIDAVRDALFLGFAMEEVWKQYKTLTTNLLSPITAPSPGTPMPSPGTVGTIR